MSGALEDAGAVARTRRSGRKSATASTTTSSTGPRSTRVVAGYRARHRTGVDDAALGLRLLAVAERYKTQQEASTSLDGFRRRHIPIDTIVQDWQYWQIDTWGSHEFEAARFPDPDEWIRQIHDQHAQLMISVWGKFYPGTDELRRDAGRRAISTKGR